MHSSGILVYAFKRLQEFVEQNYWQPIEFQLSKRENLLRRLYHQISAYQVCEGKKLPSQLPLGRPPGSVISLAKMAAARARKRTATQTWRIPPLPLLWP